MLVQIQVGGARGEGVSHEDPVLSREVTHACNQPPPEGTRPRGSLLRYTPSRCAYLAEKLTRGTSLPNLVSS